MPDSRPKNDYLGECNTQGVPHEDFHLQFCSRCVQPECLRSQHGKSRFEARVANWEESLFVHVPRMSPEDGRYKVFSGKRFLEVPTGTPLEINSGWIDPRDLVQPKPEIVEAVASEVPPQIETQIKMPEAPKSAPEPKSRSNETPAIRNTPSRFGQMIGPVQPEKPAINDPWDRKVAVETNEKASAPGVKIRIGV